MRITNLRIIWHASSMPRINLSIGFGCINALQSKFTASKGKGSEGESLFVFARVAGNQTKFEFIFTAIPPAQHTRLYGTLQSVLRAYETTKLYRELKMRGAVIDDSENLRLLPQEQLCDRVTGVWNLSQDQGSLGTMFVTNCRVVWYAQTNSQYNVSIPYLQLFSVRLRESKFGIALVLETTSVSGEYILGFRVSPNEKLKALCQQVQALLKAQLERPNFGVMLSKEKPTTPKPSDNEVIDHLEEDAEVDEKSVRTDAFAAYFTDGAVASEERRPPVYSEELGLAVEQLKTGFTIADLWTIRVD